MSGDGWHAELLAEASARLPAHVLRYFLAGAEDEVSLAESLEAWRAVRFRPRVLQDVRHVDLATRLLGAPYPTPIGIAPTSMQRWAHPDGELAMARGARERDALLVVSSNAGTTFEEIGATGVRWWLQAYLTADRSLIAPTLERAVAAGAGAVVLTVDTPVPGPKRGLAPDGAFGGLDGRYGLNHPAAVRGETPGAEHAQDLSPDDLTWLGQLTGRPVVAKGVLRADDARRCVDAGAAAVWVSNHGGRQLDRAIPTAEALPAIVAGVGGSAEVYVDGGIRSGLDALAALALGADAVFCGRPPLLGLAVDGADGVARVLASLADELENSLRLMGTRSPAEARNGLVRGLSYLP